MADNFFKVKNGINLPTLSVDPTVTPPANSAAGDMAFYNGKLYIYNGTAWGVKPGSGSTGLIVNADVDSAAAIAGTKIDPNFGSQNVTTSGSISTSGSGGITAAGLLKTNSQLQVLANGAAGAVFIEQLGSGNAFVVADSTSPDTTVTLIDASGNVGIGVDPTGVLANKLEVVGNAQVTGAAKVVSGDLTFDSAKGIESHTAASSLNVGTGSNTSTVNIGTGTGVQTVNIGTGSGTTTINIGATGDNVVVAGTLTTVNTTNLDVADKNITLNKGGAAGSANGAGINIEANSVVQASLTYAQTDGSAQPQDAFTFSGTGAVAISSGTTAQRPNTPSNGMIRYNSSNGAFEGYASNAWSAIGGGATTDRFVQASPVLSVNQVVYLNGSLYTAANATAANTAEVVGIVTKGPASLGTNTYEITLFGEVSGLVAANFTENALPATGDAIFLSTTDGKMTVTEPNTVGQVSIPVGVSSGSGTMYFAPKRGVVVGAANARTTISVANSAATSVVDVTNYNSLKLEGELNVNRSSGGNQRAYYTVEATKNGAGTWQVSAGYTGDDILYTTLPTWDVSGTQLQVTMPTVTNFTSASLTYSLNAPAVGASLPLSVDSSALNIVADAPLSYRNRIINGDMRIDQRNSGASVTQQTGALFPVDRFRVLGSASSKFTAQQNAGSVTPPAGYTNYLGMTSSAATAVGASDYYLLQHSIEGLNVADLAWGTANAQAITLSFWARSSLTGTHSGSLQNNAGDRSYAFSYTVNAANTWEQKTVTIPGDTTGTWLTNSSIGVKITWSLGSGSTFTTAANSWVAGNFFGANSSVNVVGTNGATFYLTGVQLEVGSKASAFERRPYGMELQLCQRYYEVVPFVIGTAASNVTSIGYYKVTKRGTPVLSTTLQGGTGGAVAALTWPDTSAGLQGFNISAYNSIWSNASVTANSEL